MVHALSTAGTGGFGAYNASAANFSPYIQWVLTAFMFLFGVNFNLYYLLLLKRGTEFLRNTELKVYAGIVLVSVAAITIDILPLYQSFSVSLRQAAFQVTSIMSTTGFITADFTVWSPLSKMVLLMLMFVGGCAGQHRRRPEGIQADHPVQDDPAGAAPHPAPTDGGRHQGGWAPAE